MEDLRQGGSCPPAEAGGHDPGKGVRRLRRSAEQRAEIVQAFVASGQSVAVFSAAHGLCEVTLRAWLKAAGVTPPRAARGGRRAKAPTRRHRHFSPDEKRAAIEAYQATELSQDQFARTWGVSVGSLRAWLSRYEQEGPQGLEPRPRGKAVPGDGRLLSPELKDAIVATKSAFRASGCARCGTSSSASAA